LYITQQALISDNQGCVDSEVFSQSDVNCVNNQLEAIDSNACVDSNVYYNFDCQLDHVNNTQVCFSNEVINVSSL
jgi:hypothetical protein